MDEGNDEDEDAGDVEQGGVVAPVVKVAEAVGGVVVVRPRHIQLL